MNSSRTRAVRLLTGSAAGALALGALALVPAPATAAAVPDQTRLTTATQADPGAPAIDPARTFAKPVAFKKATKTTTVKNSKQLRKAVSKANRRTGTDKIVLTSNVRLKQGGGKGNGPLKGDIDVTDDLLLLGAGNVIDAKRVDRIFDVTSGTRLDLRNVSLVRGAPAAGESGGAVRGTGATVIARNVTAANNKVTGDGASGGAFFNDDGVLRVKNSTLARNSAVRAGGAIEANAGATRLDNTVMTANEAGAAPGNGGAIHLSGDGKVTVKKSGASNNVAAAEGGAFWNSEGGIFLVYSSSFAGNSAGGAEADNGGGALYNDGGVMYVVTSDLTDNSATGAAGSGGAILNNLGDLTVESSRMIGNAANRAGGAVEANGGTTRVVDSVMRANAAGSAPGNGGALHLSGAGDVLVSGGRVVDNTAALEGGGLWNSLTGTMEVAQVKVVGNTAAGAAADNGGGGLYNDGGELLVRGSELDSNTATGTAGSGGGILNNAGLLTVVNTTINGGSAPRAGGAIEANVGTTVITRSSLEENTAGPTPGNGGAVHLTGAGSVVVTASSFGANSATAEGGALWNSLTGTMSIERSEIIANTASGADSDQGGGGVYTDGGDLTITDSVIRDNSADGAAGSGGGVLNKQATVTISASSLTGNNAVRAGGAIEALEGSTTVDDGTVLSANLASASPGNGGALHLSGAGTVDVTDIRVVGNVAALEGGGLWNSAVGTMTVTDSFFSGNEAQGVLADNGGGALYNDGGSLTVSGSTFESNSATGTAGSGGAVLNNQGTLVVSDSVFSGNDALRAGGGIETSAGSVTLTDVDFDANTTGAAPGNGGAVHAGGANTVVYTGGTVSGNDAANEGGGLWCSNSGSFTATGIAFSANTAPDGADVYHQDPATPPTTSTCVVNGTMVPQGSGLPLAP